MAIARDLTDTMPRGFSVVVASDMKASFSAGKSSSSSSSTSTPSAFSFSCWSAAASCGSGAGLASRCNRLAWPEPRHRARPRHSNRIVRNLIARLAVCEFEIELRVGFVGNWRNLFREATMRSSTKLGVAYQGLQGQR